jgi:DNA-binding NtrC family response regulator
MLLDEVGEMSLRMQTMLLRFLEIGEIQRIGAEWQHARVDVRIIAATNRDLFEQTRQKDFREDLYYRLNVVHMVVLPLRARREDIWLLFAHFLRTVAEQYRLPVCRLSEDGVAQLRAYHWPGNVRELKNVAERVAVRCPGQLLTSVTLPADRRSQRNAQPSEPPATALGQMIADGLYDRMAGAGESFWTTVREPFIGRDITRDTVRAIIRRGLVATRGNYRMMAALFNCPTSDYKRFLKALDTHECHMRFQDFRTADRQFPHARQYPTSDATRPPIPTANG